MQKASSRHGANIDRVLVSGLWQGGCVRRKKHAVVIDTGAFTTSHDKKKVGAKKNNTGVPKRGASSQGRERQFQSYPRSLPLSHCDEGARPRLVHSYFTALHSCFEFEQGKRKGLPTPYDGVRPGTTDPWPRMLYLNRHVCSLFICNMLPNVTTFKSFTSTPAEHSKQTKSIQKHTKVYKTKAFV